MRSRSSHLATLVLAVGLVSCADEDPDPVCGTSPGSAPHVDVSVGPCENLSAYRFFTGFEDDGRHVWNDGVVPYDLNTPLFSDYTVKLRAIYVPPDGETAAWRPFEEAIDEAFMFPVGSVLIKTFAVAEDLRDPSSPVDVIETRLLVHAAQGWRAHTYIWNEERTDAFRRAIGREGVELEWTHTDGTRRHTNDYLIPSERDCRNCHGSGSAGLRLLGPRAPQMLGREALSSLQGAGLVAAEPSEHVAEPFPSWNADGTTVVSLDDMDGAALDWHARSYFDANCAACHNPTGNTEGAGLDLRVHVRDIEKLGICKTPSAAGSEAQGGRAYDVVPGAPDASVLIFRVESSYTQWDHANRRMPPRGRSIPHDEGVALLRRWIEWLDSDEARDAYPGLADRSCGD
jgi:uncharacterized repeat protein (TIGR03806 family)